MTKFIAIPKDGMSIRMDSISLVTRNVPWQPVQDLKTGKVQNADGDRLEVTLAYGHQDDTATFFDEEAMKVNDMFFAPGAFKHEDQTLWFVMQVSRNS